MQLPIWQVDAFSNRLFGGNPAAVVLLERWPDDALLLAVAKENNLAETAFISRDGADYRIRWFTPGVEVPLCGHATLAAAWVVFHRLEPSRARVVFASQSGALPVDRQGERLLLDFPANPVSPVAPASNPAAALRSALGIEPLELYQGFQWLAVYRSEDELRALRPDMRGILATGIHGIIATAPATDCDFVSRFFAPAAGIDEDPVTGSSHTRLVPYWAHRLGRDRLYARQVSARGGELWCELRGDRVSIAGEAVLYLEGSITLPL